MLKPIQITAQQFQRAGAHEANLEHANFLFKLFHGFYGNLFLSKFATGMLDGQGKDQGIASARNVWAHSLAKFDRAVVEAAAMTCQASHPEYPPSLPQFIALCAAGAPRQVYKPDVPALGMGQALRSEYARKARATVEKHRNRANERRMAAELPRTLDGLKQAIAGAVALAGGDECATLLRLDRELAGRGA